MKNYYLFRLLCLLVLLVSCDSFDQDAFNRGHQEGQNLDYVVPTSTPQSVEEYDIFLHGEEQNLWVAREFILEGLQGFQDCRLDDTFTIRRDGTYQFNGGDMSCGGEDVSNQSGTYRKDYDNNRLIFDEGTERQVIMTINGLEQGVIAVSAEVLIFGVPMSIEGVYTVSE